MEKVSVATKPVKLLYSLGPFGSVLLHVSVFLNMVRLVVSIKVLMFSLA